VSAEKPPIAATPASPEDRFWGIPAEPSRTMTFVPNNLMDEKVDLLADISDSSFSMPTPAAQNRSFTLSAKFTPLGHVLPEEPEGEDANEKEDITVKVSHVTFPRPQVEDKPTPSPPIESKHEPEVALGSSTRDGGRIRITAEVDRITTKLALIHADDLELPQPPSAKATIARLKDLANQVPSPESPSQSSLSATSASHGPTGDQVLMAFMLYELLSAPKHTISMREMKELLLEKTKSNPGLSVSALGQNPTRVLYKCVGKRMLKLPRVNNQQMVAFDA